MLGEKKLRVLPMRAKLTTFSSHPLYHRGLQETYGELSRLIRSMVSNFPLTAKIGISIRDAHVER